MTDENANTTEERQRLIGWPPPPKMQIWIIVGICALINIVLIGIWLLVVYLR